MISSLLSERGQIPPKIQAGTLLTNFYLFLMSSFKSKIFQNIMFDEVSHTNVQIKWSNLKNTKSLVRPIGLCHKQQAYKEI